MSSLVRCLLVTCLAGSIVAGAAGAQILPGAGLPSAPIAGALGTAPAIGPGLQGLLASPGARQAVQPSLDSVSGLPESLLASGPSTLLDLRRLRLQQLIRTNRAQLEADPASLPIRRGIVVVVDPGPDSLARAVGAGFRIISDDRDSELGLRSLQLAVPAGMSARDGLKRLRRAAPELQADFDHVFEPAGGALAPVVAALAASGAGAGGRTIGMIDGGVASHPSLAGARIEQNGFAGPPQPTGHGTAVASLLVGSEGPFVGAARGASLLVADVYGGNRAAGSATAVVKALGWLAARRAQVINVSLVGPPNALLARAIDRVQARGIRIVAAVGNDGPAAPPQYPASYPGVVAVTGVDAGGRALIEAGKASHLDFGAPGADMAAALPGKGYSRVRGTSFAAPLAAARLVIAGSPERLAAEATPGKGKIGRGIVCAACRIDPRTVGAR